MDCEVVIQNDSEDENINIKSSNKYVPRKNKQWDLLETK